MEPLRIFDEFRLEGLDDKWVKSVWESEFLTFNKPPDSYAEILNSEDTYVLLSHSSGVIRNWITEGKKEENVGSRAEVSWQTLISLNINPRSLLPVLGYLIKSGQAFDADEEARQFCLKATDLYFALLSVPGSNAFQVFHHNLYQLALSTFKLSESLVQKSRKTRANMDLEDLYGPEADDTLFATEKLTLTKGLNTLMFNMTEMLKEFCLCHQPRSLEITVHFLFQVAILAREVINFADEEKIGTQPTINSLSYNAYTALNILCSSNHGPVDITIRLIAKYLLPNLVSNQDELLPKELAAVRGSMINFLEKVMETHIEEARLGVTTLIQHLMVKCSERVEARLKLAAIILRLINSCEEKVYVKVIEDLILLAHHNKVNLRIFAQEIMGKHLADHNISEKNFDSQKIRKLILATVLSRCVDSSSLVRGKAMSIIAEVTNLQNNTESLFIKDIFENSDPEKPLPTPEILRQAIIEDIDPLPGSNTVVHVFIARVEDERAFVRRSALQTLANLVRLSPGLLNALTSVLGLHCRDPAMIVRRYSVQVFTQLLESFPEHPLLAEDWVKHVLPQIFDAEVRVQEKVLESLQQLILNNMTNFENEGDDSAHSDLPWLILTQITEQKMRKHLTKACAIWAKTNVLTDSLVEKIKSHLGKKNDIPAWVLLAAIAKYKELPDMNQHITNYKEILCENTFQAYLVIEVLRNSWPNLNNSFLQALRSDLFEYLRQFRVNFNLVGTCSDLLFELTKHLEQENGDNIVKESCLDLMKLAEAQLEKFIEHEESGKDSLYIYLKAMTTLGHASHLCTASISPSTLRILQGLVVEWDSLPEAVKYLQELRAAAVTVLGQQALRDREIAQEILPMLGHMMRINAEQNSNVEAAVKVNAAKALADICIRFTALAEPYLPDMCITMKDPNPVIREAVVVLFIQLLLEDFIKVKGPFFFQILTMLTDTDEMVRDLTVFLIKERLLVKNKTLIFRQFLESIFYYNSYKLRNDFSGVVNGQRGVSALRLPGKRNRTQRRMIYNFMLEHLEPNEKLKIILKLESDILRAVICGLISVQKEEGLSVLKDCLYVLAREELHPSSCSKRTNDDSQDENGTTENLPVDNATNAVANEIKKQRIDVLIPTLIKLKRMLGKIQSSFGDYVTKYYLRIAAEYKKEEFSTIFREDPDLQDEIENDRK